MKLSSFATGRIARRLVLVVLLGASAASAQGHGGGAKPTVVRLGVAERVPFEEPVVLVGTVHARHHAELPAEVAGRIRSWSVEEGAALPENGILLELDAREIRTAVALASARLEEAEAQLRASRARAERARLVRDRNRSLAEERLAATASVETAEADHQARAAEVDSWNATLAERRAELDRARLDLARTEIRAPFEGTLVEKLKERGEWVRAGEGVARWASTSELEVAARVSAPDFPFVILGAIVEIVPDAFSSRRYPGRVARRVPEADTVTRTFPVEIQVTDPSGGNGGPRLEAGMLVRVEISPADRPDRLIVPRDALVLRGNTTLIYVPDAAGQTVEARHVRTGLSFGDRVEITEGIEDGERVVVTGNDGLRPGASITIRE